jgi:hypothetical protein
MPIPDPIRLFIKPLNDLKAPYMVTGATACIAYGQPRLTHDLDLVLELNRKIIPRLATAFPAKDFYCPPEEILVIEATRPLRGHFNLIHHESGLKADCYLTGDDSLHRWGMANRRRLDLSGESVWLAPPEYVVIRKLEYFREGGSEKHGADIRGILAVSETALDFARLDELIRERQLQNEWNSVSRK